MSVYRPKGSPFYHYDFRLKRRRFNGSTGTANKREARAVEDRKRHEARAEIAADEANRSAPMTIDIAAGLYYTQVGQHHVNAKSTLRDLNRIVRFFGPNTQLRDITSGKVAELIARRRGEGVANATVNRSVTEVLRKVFRRAVDVWGQDIRIDLKAHMLPEPKERTRELTDHEEAALEQSMRPDYLPIWRFALASGVRMAEAVNLTWPMVDWGNRVIRLVVKGSKPHVIPLSSKLREVLWPLQGDHETAVFTYVCRQRRAGRIVGEKYPVTYQGLKSMWRRSRSRSGVQDFRFHDNRHTAATRILRETGNIKIVKELLGHEDIATTSKYAHVTMDDIRDAMDRVTKSRNNSRSSSTRDEKPSKINEM